jgi:hypothetical protein
MRRRARRTSPVKRRLPPRAAGSVARLPRGAGPRASRDPRRRSPWTTRRCGGLTVAPGRFRTGARPGAGRARGWRRRRGPKVLEPPAPRAGRSPSRGAPSARPAPDAPGRLPQRRIDALCASAPPERARAPPQRSRSSRRARAGGGRPPAVAGPQRRLGPAARDRARRPSRAGGRGCRASAPRRLRRRFAEAFLDRLARRGTSRGPAVRSGSRWRSSRLADPPPSLTHPAESPDDRLSDPLPARLPDAIREPARSVASCRPRGDRVLARLAGRWPPGADWSPARGEVRPAGPFLVRTCCAGWTPRRAPRARRPGRALELLSGLRGPVLNALARWSGAVERGLGMLEGSRSRTGRAGSLLTVEAAGSGVRGAIALAPQLHGTSRAPSRS